MNYRARITTRRDSASFHFGGVTPVAVRLRELDAAIVLQQGATSAEVRPTLAVVDLMQALADLKVTRGATFEMTCSGCQAREAFDALCEYFTTDDFVGSEVIALEVPEETDDA